MRIAYEHLYIYIHIYIKSRRYYTVTSNQNSFYTIGLTVYNQHLAECSVVIYILNILRYAVYNVHCTKHRMFAMHRNLAYMTESA